MNNINPYYHRVAIFGLTGDPFTIAHRNICRQAIDFLGIDKLYVIPTVVDYHRNGKVRWLTDLQRVYCMEEMLWTLGSKYNHRYEIDTNELALKSLCEGDEALYDEVIKPRRFIHTLLDFKARLAKSEEFDAPPDIMLIIGVDELRIFKSWHRWDAVLANINCLVVVDESDCDEIGHDYLSEIYEKVRGRVRTLHLSDDNLRRVSATAIRKCNYGCLEDYLRDVQKYDLGELDLKKVRWTEKKGR